MEEVEPLQFTFYRWSCLLTVQGYGWCDHDCLRYRTYLIIVSYELKYAIAFAYVESFSAQKWAATDKKIREPHQEVGDTEEV